MEVDSGGDPQRHSVTWSLNRANRAFALPADVAHGTPSMDTLSPTAITAARICDDGTSTPARQTMSRDSETIADLPQI